MKSVKQYAAERGVSIQAVHQQIERKRNKEKLKGHIEFIEGVKYIDDIAEQILDESRKKTPIIIESDKKDQRVKELEEELAHARKYISELEKANIARQQYVMHIEQKQLLLESQYQIAGGLFGLFGLYRRKEISIPNQPNTAACDAAVDANVDANKEE